MFIGHRSLAQEYVKQKLYKMLTGQQPMSMPKQKKYKLRDNLLVLRTGVGQLSAYSGLQSVHWAQIDSP
jgi:hypothetical protein